MKKFLSIILALILLLNLTGCNNVTNDIQLQPLVENIVEEVYEYTYNPVNLDALHDEINDTNYKLQYSKGTLDGYEKYLKHKSGEVKISLDEIKALQDSTRKSPESITYEEALYDVDLYFRAMKYSYGGYYYFGGDNYFNGARNKVLDKIKGQTEISKKDLETYLYDSLIDLKDGHIKIADKCPCHDISIRKTYYYDLNQKLSKDDYGYYKLENNDKWYFKECSNEDVSIEYSLLPTGEIVYSFVQFVPIPSAHKTDDVVFECNGEKRTEQIVWEKATNLMNNSYSNTAHNDTFISSVPGFGATYHMQEINEFIESAKEAKNYKNVIIDLRCCRGGTDNYYYQWYKNFTGKEANEKVFSATWRNEFIKNNIYRQEKYSTVLKSGEIVDTNQNIYVLVDDNVGSGGEWCLKVLMTLKNTVVIGSNTNGCIITGYMRIGYLPNSNIKVQFASRLKFINDLENPDDTGYMPNVWCNSSDALDYTLALINNNI